MRGRPRRAALGAALGALPVVALFVACSFPEVSFGPGTDAAADSQAALDARANVESGVMIGEDGAVLTDVVTRDDASQIVSPDACVGPPCDCDDDHWPSSLDCAGPDSGLRELPDCDDLDPLRHPEAGPTSEPPPPGKDGDWNCDGTVSKTIKQASCGGNGLLGCSGTDGFQEDVACGASAQFYDCQARSGLGPCTLGPAGNAKPEQICQ